MCEIIDFDDHFPKKVNGKTSKVLALASCTSRFCKCQQWMIPSEFKWWGACWEAVSAAISLYNVLRVVNTIVISLEFYWKNCHLHRWKLSWNGDPFDVLDVKIVWIDTSISCTNNFLWINLFKLHGVVHRNWTTQITHPISTPPLSFYISVTFPGHPCQVTCATCLGLQTGQSSEPKMPNSSSERK